MMHATEPDQVENEFRNIKLKLKGPNRHSELQAVKALMAMSAQHTLYNPYASVNNCYSRSSQNQVVNLSGLVVESNDQSVDLVTTSELSGNESAAKRTKVSKVGRHNSISGGNQNGRAARKEAKEKPIDLSRSESPEPIYGLTITMTEDEFKELAEREGIEDVIGEPVCKLCGGLFSGPLGIALHMCPAMKRQTYRCDICGEDKWKTKANLHSHIKWCKKRLSIKTEQHESKQVY